MSLNETINNLGDSIINLVDKKRHGTLGLEQGDVGYDKKVWSDINKYKHSTFDKSKFTVVGSPTITEDGVLIKNTSGDGISFIRDIPLNKTIEIQEEMSVSVKTTEQAEYIMDINVTGATTSNPYITFYKKESGDIQAEIKKGDSKPLLYLNFLRNYEYEDGDILLVKFIIKDKNLHAWALNKTTGKEYNTNCGDIFGSSTTLGYVRNFRDGLGFAGIRYNLKQFSITVDGKEVFSGNKTEIDVIKEDNYTVVGSPVISEDGVASGFSTSNYLTTEKFDMTKPFEVITKVTLQTSTKPNAIWQLTGTSGWYNYLMVNWYNGRYDRCSFLYQLSDSSTGSLSITHNFAIGGTYYLKFGWTGFKYYLEVLDNNRNRIGYTEKEITLPLYTTSASRVVIGRETHDSNYIITGSIDLNSFKIYVDGNLVYQPCLKIPYTESKTGSKIVNEIYRDRVIDMYEQEGQAGYYTIQEGKKGNYTVIGAPTIADGIASGFGTNSFITKVITTGENNFDIISKFYYSAKNINQVVWRISDYYNLFINTNNQIILRVPTEAGNWHRSYGILTPETEGYIYVKYSVNEGKTYCYTSTDGVNWTSRINSDVTTYSNQYISNTTIYIGVGGATGANPFGDKIDLNAFKIYIDGKLAYQAVTPPNYTLPMGDVYGVLSTKSNSSEIAGYSVPSDKYINLTVGASGSTYTAPANGFFKARAIATNSNQELYLGTARLFTNSYSTATGNKQSLFLPVAKGEVMTLYYNTNAANFERFQFVYAEGSKED